MLARSENQELGRKSSAARSCLYPNGRYSRIFSNCLAASSSCYNISCWWCRACCSGGEPLAAVIGVWVTRPGREIFQQITKAKDTGPKRRITIVGSNAPQHIHIVRVLDLDFAQHMSVCKKSVRCGVGATFFGCHIPKSREK